LAPTGVPGDPCNSMLRTVSRNSPTLNYSPTGLLLGCGLHRPPSLLYAPLGTYTRQLRIWWAATGPNTAPDSPTPVPLMHVVKDTLFLFGCCWSVGHPLPPVPPGYCITPAYQPRIQWAAIGSSSNPTPPRRMTPLTSHTPGARPILPTVARSSLGGCRGEDRLLQRTPFSTRTAAAHRTAYRS